MCSIATVRLILINSAIVPQDAAGVLDVCHRGIIDDWLTADGRLFQQMVSGLRLDAAGGVGYFYIAVIILSSLLNAIYFFRVIEKIFINPDAGLKEVHPQKGKLELPWQMLLPLVIMGVGILVLGLSNATIVSDLLQIAMPEVLIR